MIINIEKTNQTIQSYLDLYLKESNKTKYISKDCFGIFSKLLPSTKIAKSDNLLDLVEEAKESNAIMLSSLTKEILFFGLYSKYGIENLDLFPLGDLFISEIS